MKTLPGRLSELLDPGDSVLVLCPPFVTDGSVACLDLLTVAPPAQENVLCITYTQSPSDRLALCNEYGGMQSADASIINVEANARSTATSVGGDDSTDVSRELAIDHVSSPADLTDLGVKITTQLDEWKAEAPDRQIVACFHSVTALLQYVDRRPAFKFLDVLTDRFTAADAISHYHMDASAHDERTINSLVSLFDVVCEYENGEWTLRTAAP